MKHSKNLLLILLTIILSILSCISEPQKNQTVNGLKGDTYYNLTTTANYNFDGNIQTLKKEIYLRGSGVEFIPSTNSITGIVTMRSNWEYIYSSTTYEGSFFIQDKNAGIMILYKSDEEAMARVGEKITLSLEKVVNDSKQALVLSFDEKNIIRSSEIFPLYTNNADTIQPALSNLNQVFTITGVVQNNPGISGFDYNPESDFTASLKSDEGTLVNFQLGQDLVRGTMDGYSFEFLKLTKYNLKKGQRVRITGPAFYSDDTLKIALENKEQIQILDPAYTDEVSGFIAVYNPILRAVRLSWLNPDNAKGVLIKRSYSAFPSDPWNESDGEIIFTGYGNFAYDYNPAAGQTAQYTAFTYDSTPNYSKPGDSSRAYTSIPGTKSNSEYSGACTFVINEVGVDPDGEEYNGDGVQDSNAADDEFIEIINKDCGTTDIGGWTFNYKGTVHHTFAEGTILNNNEAALIFGGGKPSGIFGGSYFTTVNGEDGTLGYSPYGLSNSSGYFSLYDGKGNLIDSFTYSQPTGGENGFFLVRSPEITGDLDYNTDKTLMTPGLQANGNMFNPDTAFLLRPNSGLPANGGSIPISGIIQLIFNLPIMASSASTNNIKLYKDIATCAIGETAISVSASSNILSITPSSALSENSGYCIKISDDFQSDTSSMGGNDVKLSTPVYFVFTTNTPDSSTVREVRTRAESLSSGDSENVYYIIENALVSYIDKSGNFYIQKDNDAGIKVADANNPATSCSALSLSSGDVINVAVLSLEKTSNGIEAISSVSCLKKNSSGGTVNSTDLSQSFVDSSYLGSSVTFIGILTSKGSCTGSYCTHTIQGLYDSLDIFQNETGSYAPFSSFSEGDFVKVTGVLSEYYGTLQIEIDSSMGKVEAGTDYIPPEINSVSLSGSNVPWDKTELVVSFNENIDSSSISSASLNLGSGASVSSVSVSANKATFTISLPAQENSYNAEIQSGIKDSAGNTMSYAYLFTFSTIDPSSIQIADHLVISEVGNTTDGNTYNDYIEIYNPTASAISLNGYYIGRDSTCTISGGFYEFSALDSVSIPSHEFYLIARAGNTVNADWTGWSGSIGEDYCVVLTNSSSNPTSGTDSNVVDFVSFNSGTGEGGTSAGVLADGTAFGRNTCGTDTNDNASDFGEISSPAPKNTSSSAVDPAASCLN